MQTNHNSSGRPIATQYINKLCDCDNYNLNGEFFLILSEAKKKKRLDLKNSYNILKYKTYFKLQSFHKITFFCTIFWSKCRLGKQKFY